MMPVYTRMSDTNLLRRMQKGKNANECLHSVIWSRCSKMVFVGHRKLTGAVAMAVGAFNAGASHTSAVMELLAIEQSEITQAYFDHRDSVRCSNADRVLGHDAKARRRQKGDRRKLARANSEHGEGTSYMVGGFDIVKNSLRMCALACCYYVVSSELCIKYICSWNIKMENTFFPVCK